MTALVVLILLLSAAPMPSNSPGAHRTLPGTPSSVHSAGASPLATVPSSGPSPRPSVNANNPNCFPITAQTCVRIANSSEPDIVPFGTNHSSSVQPNYTDSINLYLMSEVQLQWPNATSSGIHSPITMNVTGIQWNGDKYFCYCDGTVYHGGSGANAPYYTYESSLSGTNRINVTYPYVYLIGGPSVSIANRSSTGTNNFWPGETVYWSIELQAYNASRNPAYTSQEGPVLSYRVGGAWAFSPRVGAVQYVQNPAAAQADLEVSHTPGQPNWNDSVNVTIRTTLPDVENRTLIGRAVLYVQEYHDNLAVGNATQILFPISQFTITGAPGVDRSTARIPSSFTQVANNVISFWIVAKDSSSVSNDTIIYPATNITVNGNGSFATGVFGNDLVVSTDPSQVVNQTGAAALNATPIAPGTNVTVNVTSSTITTSLLSAEVLYSFSYPDLGETVSAALPLHRVNSTTFRGVIPGMPVGSWVNLSLEVLDYTHRLETSPTYSYSMQPLEGNGTPYSFLTLLPQNATFFYVYVFNNGSNSYVDGASVQVRGPTPAFDTVSATRFGVAYPNATGNFYTPLLLAANTTYNITVTTPTVSIGSAVTHTVSLLFFAVHDLTYRGTLVRGDGYIVTQEESSQTGIGAVYFWLNGTLPTTVYSPSTGSTSLFVYAGAIAGLVGAGAISFAIWQWFGQIQARRKAEEKRVTL